MENIENNLRDVILCISTNQKSVPISIGINYTKNNKTLENQK